MWTVFECESMADFHDIYLKCDVLLLADFFEKFRASCLAHYSLDAIHYYTAPGLAWDAALRMTHVSLELTSDTDMFHFIENSIRGGISMITTRYAQANSPTLPGYDANRPHRHLIYLDANNLFGWAMFQHLPTGGLRFLQPDEVEALAAVGDTMLTITTHSPPSRWRSVVICIRPLSMQPFHRRPKGLLQIDKQQCFWEDTQENLKKRVHVELITDVGILRKRIAKPNFCRGNPITDCMTAIQCTVATLTLCRPIYVGFSVLVLSKLHMYNFYYNHMCVKYPGTDQLRLLFTDTDSLAYAVQTEDIYRDMAGNAAIHYDFSEYPLNHQLYSAMNRKAIGCFKDELNSVPMQKFVGARPKCYAFLCMGKVSNNMLQHTNPVEKKTAKGVKRRVKDAHLRFEHYLDALKNFHISTLHTVRTVHMCKVGLAAYDTKRWLCDDTIHTHAHGQRSTLL